MSCSACQTVGNLFGFRSFGRIVGAVSVFTGLASLLIIPISAVAIGAMQSKFWKLSLTQVR